LCSDKKYQNTRMSNVSARNHREHENRLRDLEHTYYFSGMVIDLAYKILAEFPVAQEDRCRLW